LTDQKENPLKIKA